MSTAILPATSGPWGDTPKVVDRSFEDNVEAERNAAVAKVNERAESQRAHQLKLGQLQRAVTEAEQRLANATAFKEHLAKRVVELRELVTTLWGKTREVVNVDPHSQACDAYNTILVSEIAIKDWSRIEPVLRANVDKAKEQLALFQHQR
jgi:hypothetical protein